MNLIAASFVWGSIPTWALSVFALVVAWRVSRGGGGSAVSELSKANEVLTRRVHELGAEVRDLRVENADLQARTDVSLALAPLVEWSTQHEQRAQERHEQMTRLNQQTLAIMGLIADRLGPDNGDGERRAA